MCIKKEMDDECMVGFEDQTKVITVGEIGLESERGEKRKRVILVN
jgi:hypothetical protein